MPMHYDRAFITMVDRRAAPCKHIVFVERVVRSPAGKVDYRWAEDTARQALGR